MELTNRTLAAVTALAMATLIFTVPNARSAETAVAPSQERISTERFAAPALIPAAGLDEVQLATYGAAQAAKQDRLVISASGCEGHSWPNIPLRCLFSDDTPAARRTVRMITIEERVGAATSVLSRMPANVAER